MENLIQYLVIITMAFVVIGGDACGNVMYDFENVAGDFDNLEPLDSRKKNPYSCIITGPVTIKCGRLS